MAYSYDGYLRFNTEIDKSGFDKGVNSMKSAAEMGAKAIGIGLTAATTAVTALSTAAIAAGSNFEAGMSKVQATSQASAADMELLSAKAKEMGAITKFSATESAEALNYMAQAGWNTQSMLEGLPGVMNLAAASGESLGSVSDIVTDSLTAFGMQASDSAKFADVLAQAAAKSNTDVAKMGATFKYVAAVAGAMKYSIEDTAVAVGLLANAGIKGEMAGTQLRAWISRLVDPTKESAAAMDALKLSVTNSDGTMKDFATIITDLRTGMAGYTDEQKASYAAMLGGQEAMSGLLAIANASEADFQSLTASINNSSGAAEEMEKTVNDNLKGDLTILGSTAESVGIKVYEKFQVPMRNAAQSATDSLGKILSSLNSGQLDKSVDKIADSAGKLLSKTADLAASGLPKLLNGFTYIIDHGKQVTSIIAGATTAFVGYNTAVKITKEISILTTAATEALTAAQITETAATGLGTKAWVLFNAAVAANPIGLAAVAIGALAAGLIYYNQVQDEATERTNELISATKDKIAAWEESKKVKLDEMQTQVSELETTKEMIDELGRLTDANGKVGDNKERVAYLSEKINEILPDTVKFIDDETVAIDGNIESLKRQIELKQANILLDELEADAAQARKERTESLKNQMKFEEDIASQEGEIEKLRTELSYAGSNARIAYLQQEVSERENQLNKTKANLDAEKEYFEERNQVIDDTSRLAIAIQKEDYAEIGRIMAQKELQLKSAGDSTREELENQVADLQSTYDYLSKSQGESTSESIKQFTTEIKKQLDEYRAELDRRTPDLEKSMTSNGENVTLGFAKGLITPYALTQIRSSANILSDAADKGVRARLRIQSPSRVAMVTGGFYTEGFADGIIGGRQKVVDAVRAMSEDSIKTTKEKATGYKEIGTLYVSYMKESINSRKNSMIEQVQRLIDDNVEKQIESLDRPMRN
ncbi:phage tail tape measure protein [Anaerotignum propionicum]|uniref:phage tail tape measure protein n=1 Tax=Anaerotignum propionicum TaxID=28446 RepID=UPI0028A0EE0B|nr:phage tail tape measure protein [Anaerotignum propionicum]